MHRSLVLIALGVAGVANASTPRAPLRPEAVVIGVYDVALVVKWDDGVRARIDDAGQVVWHAGEVPAELRALSAQLGARWTPWLDLGEARLQALEHRAEAHSGVAQPDLSALHRVEIDHPTPARLQALADALSRLDGIEFITTDVHAVPPPGDIEPPTPLLVDQQAWLEADAGVDAGAAWDVWGLDGSGTRVADCEYGWHEDHEDLVDASWSSEAGQTPRDEVASRGWDSHGTAVAGELVGQDNGYGVRGLVSGAEFATYPEWTIEGGSRRGSAIASAIDDSAPGDFVLLEMQTGGPDGRLAPAEVNAGVWTLTRVGTDAGVIVVGAAGNGTANLDSAPYAEYLGRGDSGAIIVGAGSSNSAHSRLGFSTYGTRVDVQGWGQNVFTTGYGNYARYGGDVNQAYTSRFSGTSSASPIVTGAGALIQELALRYRLDPLSPRELRTLLIETGTPGDPSIGPLPDLAAALDEVEARYDVLPSVVLLGDAAIDVAEGEAVRIEAEELVTYDLLPTHSPSWSWNVEGEQTQGQTLDLAGRDDATFDVVLTLTDELDRSASVSLRVEVVNQPPELTVEGPLGLDEGSQGRFTAAITDYVGDTHNLRWTVDEQVVDGTIEAMAWTPAQDGTYLVSAVAEDDDGGVSELIELEVVVSDVAATLDLTAPVSVPRKEAASLRVDIDDPGADSHTIAWVVDGEPVAGESGTELTWTWKEKGPHPVEVIVTDQDGVEVRSSTSIEVVPRGGCGCQGSPMGTEWLAILALLGGVVSRRRRRGVEAGGEASRVE